MVEGNRDEPLTSDAAAERLAESLISTVYRLCVKNVRKMFDLVLTALPMIEVLSGERVGRFPRCPSKPAGPSRRDKASRARPPFESLSQALLGQAQLHKLSAVENMKSVLSYERAKYIMLAGRVIDMLDRSLHRILIVANNILMKAGTYVAPS